MGKIARCTQFIFGSSAPLSGSGSVGQFGSMAQGAPASSFNPFNVQALAAWAQGWLTAVIGNNGPAIEDLNGFCFVVTSQLAYLMQMGIPEWDAGTSYYIGSLVNVAGVVYVSLVDNNTNHAVTDVTKWGPWTPNGAVVTTSGNYTILTTDSLIRLSGGQVATLPPAETCLGREFVAKKVYDDGGSNESVLACNGSELMDGQPNSLTTEARMLQVGDVIRVRSNGTGYDIV